MNNKTFSKLSILIWKNYRSYANNWCGLLLQLILPIGTVLIMLLVRTKYKPQEEKLYTSPAVDPLNFEFPKSIVEKLIYSPDNPKLKEIMQEAAKNIKNVPIESFRNADALRDKILQNDYLAGVQFDDDLSDIEDFPETLAFSLIFPAHLRTEIFFQWDTDLLFPPDVLFGPRVNLLNPLDDEPIPSYMREGFLGIQHAISMAFIKLKSGVTNLPNIEIQHYPLVFAWDTFYAFFYILLLLGVGGTFALVPFMALLVVAEKEVPLKEIMKAMGLPNHLHWIAWFSIQIMLMSGIVMVQVWALQTTAFHNLKAIQYTHWSVLAVFLWLYYCSLICYAFMICVFFNSRTSATFVTTITFVITFLTAISSINFIHTPSLQILICFVMNFPGLFAMRIIKNHEAKEDLLSWSQLFMPDSIDATISMGIVFIMLIIQCLLYLVLCLYCEQIFPQKYGIPKKWYFPFTRCMEWFKIKPRRDTTFADIDDASDAEDADIPKRRDAKAFEAEPIHKLAGVRVKGLYKEFNNKWAVKNLSINLYEDEITVLLGHNGAGKTVTISMMSGILVPSEGTIIMNGFNINTHLREARLSMGICPQYNVLFPYLTVADHIYFFASVRGMDKERVNREQRHFMNMLDLTGKKKILPGKLSGGMQRKLSLCCALAGDTKVVLCDEPSSGMDVASRQGLWELLLSEKKGRTILLTTHYMDEADVLGDRIGIMCIGELKCYGSGFFLKKKFGSGYRLVLEKLPACSTYKVTKLLSQHIPTITPETDIGSELTYILSDKYTAQFQNMFTELESHQAELNIIGFGVSVTSLEEVFMKVGAENQSGTKDESEIDITCTGSCCKSCEESLTRRRPPTCRKPYQWHAMLLKKYLYFLHQKYCYLMELLFLLLMLLASFVKSQDFGVGFSLPPLTFDLNSYTTLTTLVDARGIANDSLEDKITKQYMKLVSTEPGHNVISTGSLSLTDYAFQKDTRIPVRMYSVYLFAVTVEKDHIIAFHNQQAFHTAPMALNLVHNALAKALIGSNAEITVTLAPLSHAWNDFMGTHDALELEESRVKFAEDYMSSVLHILSIVLIFAVMFPTSERVSRAKLMQFVAGVNSFIFWLSHFIWDLLKYMMTTLLAVFLVILIALISSMSLFGLGYYLLIYFVLGVTVLPQLYVISFFFKTPINAIYCLLVLNIEIMVTAALIQMIGNNWDHFFIYPSLALPSFACSIAGVKLSVYIKFSDICKTLLKDATPQTTKLVCELKPECCVTPMEWTKHGIAQYLTYALVSSLIYWLILIILQSRLIHAIVNCLVKPQCWKKIEAFDDDVRDEKKKIEEMKSEDRAEYGLVLDNLTKFYFPCFLANNQVSFCIKDHECFGLLGVNGAGKTTISKIVTGETLCSYGAAYVRGKCVNFRYSNKDVGYCPQDNALFEAFTGHENMKIYALLRGICKFHIDKYIENLATRCGFLKHLKKKVEKYSGGTKRKLSTAIAVLGKPTVIYMDEPTTGIDPGSRHNIWKIISNLRENGAALMLTSHSIEESEALCTRLTIMVNGKMLCIGSSQHLKNKFSQGFIIKIKSSNTVRQTDPTSSDPNDPKVRASSFDRQQSDADKVKAFIFKEFTLATLESDYMGLLTFYIPLAGVKWSRVFGVLEANSKRLQIQEYSISQTRLEEIFLQFAFDQREARK